MIQYKIKYVYDTGDSATTERDQVGYLGIVWTNLEIAKQNLQRIKEHYIYYRTLYSISQKELKKLNKDVGQKDWFFDQSSSFILQNDDNVNVKISNAPWCGHFERLNEAEVIIWKSDLKISFKI